MKRGVGESLAPLFFGGDYVRTIRAQTPVTARCAHCQMPDAMHSPEQRAVCEKRLLADLSRSWPRTAMSQAERDEQATKKLNGLVQSLTKVLESVELNYEERGALKNALNAANNRIKRMKGNGS